MYINSRLIISASGSYYTYDKRERIINLNVDFNSIIVRRIANLHCGAGLGLSRLYQNGYWNEDDKRYYDSKEFYAPSLYAKTGFIIRDNSILSFMLNFKYSLCFAEENYHGITANLGISLFLQELR